MENKKFWFAISIILEDGQRHANAREKIDNDVDLILAAMGSEDEPYKFLKMDQTQVIYLFKTSNRKRKGQLVKFCQRFLDDSLNFQIKGLTRDEQIVLLTKLEKNHYQIKQSPIEVTIKNYSGSDLDIFKDKSKL